MLGVFVTSPVIDKRETKIRSMFNNIAPSYDFLNHLLSCNVDHYWRWQTTRMVPPVVADSG
ncbi:MAG: class I SAM-dependent methyltransferase, partial [Planctomycetes bacterium]|nr:class I SAM-dependent methyltransferase [Planctomycetota bacterium]